VRRFALLGAALVVVPIAVAAGGNLDPSFSGDGKVLTDVGDIDFAEDVAIQRDGKIVVVGWSQSADSTVLFVARYLPSGALDTPFGIGGVVRTRAGGYAAGFAVAIQQDGKIVAAGDGQDGSAQTDFMLARYNADGTPDTSFDGDGLAFANFDFGGSANGVTIQPDGKIVAVGSASVRSTPGPSGEFAVARFDTDGSLDTGFDGDGRVLTSFTPVADSAVDVAVQPDGKIVVGGYAGLTFRGPFNSERPDYALARYNAGGSLDASFDGDGKTITSGGTCPGSTPCLAGDLSLQAGGKILLAGGRVARYNRDGTLDSAFGQGGRASPGLYARAVLVQPDGKVVAAGDTAPPQNDFAVARLLPNGRRDRGFGAVTDLSRGSDTAFAAAFQRDRRIVVAGTAEVRTSPDQLFDAAVVRYLNPAPPRCVVPNVRRMALRAARRSIARSRCRTGRVSRTASRRLSRGRVISQTPRSGTRLPVGGKVNLVVSKGRR
jgi:uncharacterized delta-60 repeat protein